MPEADDRKPFRFALLVLLPIAVLLFALWWAIGIPIERGGEALRAGEPEAAIAILERWARAGLRAEDFDQLLAAAHLLAGSDRDAARWLARAARRAPDVFPALRREEAGRLFLARGDYEELLRWYAAVRVRRESDEARLYRAAAELGAGRENEARTTFEAIDPEAAGAARHAALAEAFARRAGGTVPLFTDRAGKTIGVWHTANRDLVAVNDDFQPLLDRSGGRVTIEANLARIGTAGTIETTLDAAVQRAALEAIAPFRASLVAIDPRTHELLAVASSPGGGDRSNLAFEGSYEPGSIIKPLTALAGVEAGLLSSIFPFECEGFSEIEGRQFFDWARHGRLASSDEAMAVSCNAAFARAGLALGKDRLRAIFRRSRFGESADLGLLEVPLGREVGRVDGDFATANYAIGLEVMRVNTLHAAMIADMFANGGVMTSPVLVRARRSILGERLDPPRPPVANRVASKETVGAVLPALRAVVTDVRGTGRRAAIPGVEIAMKTGTAGDATGDFDALVLAFAPASSPRIAFAVIAENAGPAELAGAEIARSFLAAVLREGSSRP